MNVEAFVFALIAAILLAVALWFWNKLVSFISSVVYPVRVSGKWATKLMKSGQLADHESAELYQFGPRVWGRTETRDADRRRYRVTGRISGEKLCMVYKELTSNRLDTGAILLQINADGKSMNGYEIGFDLTGPGILSGEYKWTLSA